MDYRVLRTFAKHYSTGDVIPKELVESMLGAKNMFAATELQRQVCCSGLEIVKTTFINICQSLLLAGFGKHSPAYLLLSFYQIFYALADQTLFGEQPSSVRDSISIVADLKRQHTSWKHVEGTHWHTRFNHLTNYGAGTLHAAIYSQ